MNTGWHLVSNAMLNSCSIVIIEILQKHGPGMTNGGRLVVRIKPFRAAISTKLPVVLEAPLDHPTLAGRWLILAVSVVDECLK